MLSNFLPNRPDACCLCGSTEGLTGEHKIKASMLRGEFGLNPMLIGKFNSTSKGFRQAQSSRSKALHFTAKICALCNNERTQQADNEFVHFHQIASSFVYKGDDPKKTFDDERYAPGSAAYLNVFRYFAKLLCCHMADAKVPVRGDLARFAVGLIDENCISLDINEDVTFRQVAELGINQYAAHGGLIVFGDRETGSATGFHSTLTLGATRYVFSSKLTEAEQLELMNEFSEFYHWCRAKVEAARKEPIPIEEQIRLGLLPPPN